MNKFIFNDYFLEPQGKIAKRRLYVTISPMGSDAFATDANV